MKRILKIFLCVMLVFTISAVSFLSAQLFKGYTNAQLDKIRTVSKEDIETPLIFADSGNDIVLYPWDIINTSTDLNFSEYINEVHYITSLTLGNYDEEPQASEEDGLKYLYNTINHLISCYCDNYKLEDDINFKSGTFKSANQAGAYAFFKDLPLISINDKTEKRKADIVLLNDTCVYFHCKSYEDNTSEDNLSYDDKSRITREIYQNITQLINNEILISPSLYDESESAYIDETDKELSSNPFGKFYLGTIKQETIFSSRGELFDFSPNILSLLSSSYSIFFKDNNEVILTFENNLEVEYSQLCIIYDYKTQVVSGFSAKITA